MNTTTQKFIDNFRLNLEDFRKSRGLKRFELAELIGISPQLLSEFLNGTKTLSLENLLKADSIIQLGTPMNTQPQDEGLDQVNAAVLARYANNGTRIKYFQSADEGEGFVPAVGDEEPDYAALLAQLVRDGRFKEAGDLLVQIQKGPRVTASTAVKARPNAYGPTRGTVHVTDNSGRRTVIDGQSFSTTTNVINMDQSKALIEAAKKQNRKEYEAGVRKSHKSTEQEVRVNNDTVVNYSRVNMQSIADMHAESIIADKATYEANKKRIAEREERLSRIKSGRGTLEDLQARRNALRNA